MKKQFSNIANVIVKARKIADITQDCLGVKLGYKNAQFISNMERGKCSLPHHKIVLTAEVLNINRYSIVKALLADHEVNLDRYVSSVTTDNISFNDEVNNEDD